MFRTGTYYVLWQKFRKQITTLLVSALLIIVILGIYNDLFSVLKISNKESVLWLLLIKWSLIMLIVLFNIFIIKRVSTKDIKDSIQKEEQKTAQKTKLPLTPQEKIEQKEKMLRTTGLILKKHAKKKNEDA